MRKSAMKISERIIAMMLSIIMMFSVLPLNVFAVPEGQGNTVEALAENVVTVTVKEASGNNEYIADAMVTYQLFLDNATEETKVSNYYANTDANGVATFEEPVLDGEKLDIDYRKTVKVKFTVTKGGYQQATGELNMNGKWGGNSDISVNVQAGMSSVSVSKSGNGTGVVSAVVAGKEIGAIPTEGINPQFGSDVQIKITPDYSENFSKIKLVKVNGIELDVTNPTEEYVYTFTASENEYTIEVEFAVEYNISLSVKDNVGGTVFADGYDGSDFTIVPENLEDDFSLNVSVTPKNEDGVKYVLSQLFVNGEEKTLSDEAKESGTSFELTKQNVKDGAITVEAVFERIYTITFDYNADKGTVTAEDGTTFVPGSITVQGESSTIINITPKTNYRLSALTIDNGETEKFEANDYSDTRELASGSDHKIVVEFRENRYYAVVTKDENFDVEFRIEDNDGNEVTDTDKIPYGSSVKITISPSGYEDFYNVVASKEFVDFGDYTSGEWITSENCVAEIESLSSDVDLTITKGYEVKVTGADSLNVTINGQAVNSLIVEEGQDAEVKVSSTADCYISDVPSDDDWNGNQTEYTKTFTAVNSAQEVIIVEQGASVVRVDQSGNGTGIVEIFNEETGEYEPFGTESRRFDQGTKITIKIVPNFKSDFSRIKSVKIGEDIKTITNPKEEMIIEDIEVNEAFVISVEFHIIYVVTLEATEGGTLVAQGKEGNQFELGPDEKVNIVATPNNDTNGRYVISQLTVNNTPSELSETELKQGKTFEISKSDVVDGDIKINVTFDRVYTVKVTYDSQLGTVRYNFDGNGEDETDVAGAGDVIIKPGESPVFDFIPKEGYRLAKLVIDGEGENVEFWKNDYAIYDKILTENEDHTIEATFMSNRYYSVSVTQDECFVATIYDVDGNNFADPSRIPYGTEVYVNIVPKERANAKLKNYYKITPVTTTDDPEDEVVVNCDYTVGEWIDCGEEYVSNVARIDCLNGDVEFEITRGYRVVISGSASNITRTITVNGKTQGTAYIAEEGETVAVSATATSGYYISEVLLTSSGYCVKLDDEVEENVAAEEYDNGYEVTFYNIDAYKNVNVTIKTILAKDVDYPFNFADALRVYGNTFIFDSDTSADFKIPEGNSSIALLVNPDAWPKRYTHLDTDTSYTTDVTIYEIQLWSLGWGITKTKVNGINEGDPLIILFDDVKPSTSIKIESAAIEGTNGFYNDNGYVYFSYDVNDILNDYDNSTGLLSVEYQVTVDGVVAMDWAPVPELVLNDTYANGTFKIEADKYNGKNVVVNLRATDKADNVGYASTGNMSICTVNPEITVDVSQEDNTNIVNGNYYQSEQIATVTLKDKFADSNLFRSCIENAILTDKKENGGGYVGTFDTFDEENGLYVYKITFKPDSKFEWNLSKLYGYVNDGKLSDDSIECILDTVSGETVTSTSVEVKSTDDKLAFTVDKTAPTGKIVLEGENSWNEILETITFGIFKNTDLTFKTKDVTEKTSPEVTRAYYVWDISVDGEVPTSSDELIEALKAKSFVSNAEATSDELVTISDDKKFVVFASLTDMAGNTSYVCTDGIILDSEEGRIKFANLTGNVVGEGKYIVPDENEDIKISVTIEDIANDAIGADSGINENRIFYKILVSDDNSSTEEINSSLSNDEIRKLGYTKLDKNELTYAEGEENSKRTASFPVDLKDYNYDDVIVRVYAEDRAGNYFVESSDGLNIITTKPTAVITYEDSTTNENDSDLLLGMYRRDGYYKNRTATITITDRAFSSENAVAGIDISVYNNKNEAADTANAIADTSEYYEIDGDWIHGDDDTHTTTITFKKNAYYTFNFTYTNAAELEMEASGCTYNGPTPNEFTIDNVAPTVTATANSNAWKDLVDIITFGIFTNEEVIITADAKDETSNIFVSYFKSNDENALTRDELGTMQFVNVDLANDTTEFNGEVITVKPNERFVLYLRVADYAGNYSYYMTDGHIVDKIEPQVTLTFETPLGGNSDIYNIANGGINVKVNATESGDVYSGIQKIDYTIENLDTGYKFDNKLYVFTAGNEFELGSLKKSVSKEFNIDPNNFNGSNIKVTVMATDKAGNVGTATKTIDIDVTKPVIDVTYDNNTAKNGKYFAANRTATVVITERTNHFSSEDATNGIKITAVDVNGKAVNGTYTVSTWTTTAGSGDTAKHTAKITYSGDANYKFAISYTDKAGNASTTVDTNGSTAPYEFTVDKTAPVASITASSAEGRTEKWEKLLTSLNFGFWSNERIGITSSSSDTTSPISSVQYYKVSSKNGADFSKPLNAAQLKAITSWQNFSTFNIVPNEQAVVYLKVVDKAGNTSFICTNGLIADNTSPREEVMAPQITLTPQGSESGIYNSDVTVNVSVEDPTASGTFSGLKTISYRILNMGEVTQSGTLYAFDLAAPANSQLKSSWEGTIVVDSSLNNSNNVEIEIFGEDNALNSSTNSAVIQIDTTAPSISISYDNNNAVGEFFNEDRVATIVVTERNFSEDEVRVSITNSNGTVPTIGQWTMSAGSGNGDNTRWSAPIVYHADGEYTFDISCTDMAGNEGTEPVFATGTVAPSEFTIDQTNPVISVSYDKQSASGYYDSTRTATITIEEHNFNADDVDVTISATDDGTEIDAPAISEWTTRGDVHTATVVYSNNAKYTFGISCTDEASNEAEAIENEVFYVDKTAPALSITGVENNSANSGEVAPVIEYSDTNIDLDSVVITLSGSNRGNNLELVGEFSDIHNGQIFTFDDFAQTQANDDIYTLSVSVSDYAGNKTEETLIFSVNRFGSTYALSEGTKNIIGAYITEPEDIVISEVNANELSEITITLFKNNSTVELVEGEDYSVSVEGGDGEWFKYTYTVFADNFTDDGVYRINVHSKDKAGNVAENTLDTKATEINFGVDKTPPTVVVTNTEDGETYAKESHTVLMKADDNFKLADVTVYLDGDECASWSGEELEAIVAQSGEFSFEVPGDSTKSHDVEIVTRDLAGNETVEKIKDFYVTTNKLVGFYNNKVLFFGSIFGLLLLIALIIFIIVYKRRKREIRF